MQILLRNQRDASWTYITRVEHDVRAIEDRFHPLFLFGVVLVAVTILGVFAAVMVNTDANSAPPLVRGLGLDCVDCGICRRSVQPLLLSLLLRLAALEPRH